MILITNSRTLLRSDWIDAPDGTRYLVYAALYLLWAAAVTWSVLEYRKDRAAESADAIAAEAARNAEAAERNVVADLRDDAVVGTQAHDRPGTPTP
jgi:hypothetical protein